MHIEGGGTNLMVAPTVTTLPISPARASRPSNFVTESALFLAALPDFRQQVNLLATYINSHIPNKYDLGKVNGIRTFPDIYQTDLVNTEFTGDNIAFTSWIDNVYFTLYDYSTRINVAAQWFDSVVTEHGVMPYDLNKPMVSGISAVMSRSQARDSFNTTAAMFSENSIRNINSLYQAIYHTYMSNCSNEDFGSVTDTTIISTLDLGSVTDTTITYD